LVPGDRTGICVFSERGYPIAIHGFENLGQGRSTTPGITQIVMTLKIQGKGGSFGPPLDHVEHGTADHRIAGELVTLFETPE
jgi:hypothetical protein